MKSIKSYASKGIVYATTCIVRSIISMLPNKLSVIIGMLGFTDVIKRSSGVNFVGDVFNTKMKIHCQGNYAVERIATARSMGASEPFAGIARLGLENFTMLDIGANVGAYSIGAVGIGAAKVFSIEPGPLFKKLQNNIELNSLEEIVIPIQVGLASKPGKMRWYEDMQNPGNAHLVISKDSLSFEKIPTKFDDFFVDVDVITLDDLINSYDIPQIDVVKIDVEGMEWEVLSSGKRFIERDLPVIIAETHRVASDMMQYDCTTPLFNYLYSLGYESYSFKSGELINFIYPNFDLDTFFIQKGRQIC